MNPISSLYAGTKVDCPEAIYRLAEELGHIPEVQAVILFGSRARGDNAPRADVDLAVSCSRDDVKLWDKISELVENARTLLPIDLVNLERAPEDLKAQIAKDGKLLFSR